MNIAHQYSEGDLFSREKVDEQLSGPLVFEGEDNVLEAIDQHGFSLDRKFDLKAEAYLLQLAYANDKLLSLSNSRTQILSHQVECAHRIARAINKRFLIADEVGLGKTIEAGFVIKELVFRYGFKRILIAGPASLQLQWQHEMKSKFYEEFEVLDRKRLKQLQRANPNSNPWSSLGKVICSIDFIKNKSYRDDLKGVRWDAIIVDEAHRLRRDSQSTTLAYTIGEILSETTKCLLLLTATPFRGKLEELYYLIRLLDKNLLGPFQTFYNSFCMGGVDLSPVKEKVSSVLIRRTKREVGGFTRRFAKTIRFDLYPEERALYDATTQYVVEEYNRALNANNRAVGFVMIVFQKLLDSSSFALLSAMNNRRKYLQSILKDGIENSKYYKAALDTIDPVIYDELDDDGADELVRMTLQKTREEIEIEILTISNLISLAERIDKNKKGEKLKEMIQSILKKRKKDKVLIFTQFRKTQDYLEELLAEFSVEVFNGSMDRDQKELAIENFKGSAQILICTEAGGEGRNMQFCNIEVNYDLPWSPLKIEQRIGRIHRFGQPRDVFIYNFSTKDTVAERVLNVLTRKIKLFEESIGTPDVMLGQIEEELNLNKLIMEMSSGKKSTRKAYAEIDQRMTAARHNYEKLTDLIIARKMDFNYDEYYRITLKERKVSNNRIERLINGLREEDEFTAEIVGKKNTITRQYPIRYPGNDLKKGFGTFDSQKALENDRLEFLAFGNPVIDRIIEHCKSEEFGGHAGIKMVRYKKPFVLLVAHYVVTFHSVSEFPELITVCNDPLLQLEPGEIDFIEKELHELTECENVKLNRYRDDICFIKDNFAAYYTDSRSRIIEKSAERIREIQKDVNPRLDLEIEKIEDSYGKELTELEEQLERQVCQMKWFERDMRSAITRTKNRIAKTKIERNSAMIKYHGYTDMSCSIRLINVGIVIGKRGR